jgi:hypothetical protein
MLTNNLLKNMSEYNLTQTKKYDEIDIAIGGGGYNGFYVFGVNKILKKLIKDNRIQICRYAGTSVGAICCVLMVCNVTDENIIKFYHNIKHGKDFLANVKKELIRILPDNAYALCSNRVFISLTTFPFLTNHVVSTFESNTELVDTCIASSCMPLLVTWRLYYKLKNKLYLDGFISRNLILFNDSCSKQLIIQPHMVEYNILNKFIPKDSAVTALIVKGAIDAELFFDSHDDSFELPYMKWKKNNETKKKIQMYISLFSIGIISLFIIKKYR